MTNKIEVTIEAIIHATEDTKKLFDVFEELFNLKKENFSVQDLQGHFDNPITILKAKVIKKEALEFLKNLNSKISVNQKKDLIDGIEISVKNSTFHFRLDKQKLVQGNLVLQEKDAVKIKIYTPVYNKKDTIRIYSQLLSL